MCLYTNKNSLTSIALTNLDKHSVYMETVAGAFQKHSTLESVFKG